MIKYGNIQPLIVAERHINVAERSLCSKFASGYSKRHASNMKMIHKHETFAAAETAAMKWKM